MQVSAILNIVYFMSVHCIIYNIKHNPPNVKEKSGNFVLAKKYQREIREFGLLCIESRKFQENSFLCVCSLQWIDYLIC